MIQFWRGQLREGQGLACRPPVELSGLAKPHVVTGLSLLRLLFWIAAFYAPALIRLWQEIWR